jgi:cation transport ATPase
MNRLNGDTWGAALVAIAVICLFVNKGDTARQRKAHRMFRLLLAFSSLNFTFACMTEPYHTLQRTAPLANNLLIRWLIASVFFMPAWPVAETAFMRETRTREKNRALLTDYTLALLYSIAVAGALAIAVVSGT